ncbi:MAG: hypothetical protein JWN78_1433 [Bacteroidota bacterium]|nr:hypothetical protein [Bacteroidota bacterium]
MTEEEFNNLIENCQPHKIFKTNWGTFYPDDFAETLLPNVNELEAKAVKMFDGANLFKNPLPDNNISQSTKNQDLISLVSYSYPKGVEAEMRKGNVNVGENEICTFIEVAIDDKMEIFFKFGQNFKKFLSTYFKDNNIPDISQTIDKKIYKNTIPGFKDAFNNSIAHSNALAFIGKTIGVDLADADKTTLQIKINEITVKTSKSLDNYKTPKEKEHKYLIINFEQLNLPAVNYRLIIYRNKKIIYNQVTLPKVVPVKKDPKKNEDKIPLHQPGKHRLVLDCTENDILELKDNNQILTIRIEATDESKKITFDLETILLKQTLEKAEVDNFVIILDEKNNEIKNFGSEIIERQKIFRGKIPAKVYDKLSDEGKLILNLPIIMTKLGFLHGALCQIHWLEGTKDSLKFHYEFFMSEKRVENIDIKNLKEYFQSIKYVSSDSGSRTTDKDKNLFLYNEKISSAKSALTEFNDVIEKLDKNSDVGDFGNMTTHISEKTIKYNFFQAFTIGSAVGNIDDVGTALGQYSQRCYFHGYAHKDPENGKWLLNIKEVASRFVDSFSFDDDKNSIDSQHLGCWVNNIMHPKLPERFGGIISVCVQNVDYRDLRDILAGNKGKKMEVIIPNSCNDFLIYSNYRTFTDGFVKKNDLLF